MTDTTQTGVSQQPIAPTPSTEDGFQSLFDRGAFEPEKPQEAVASEQPEATQPEKAVQSDPKAAEAQGDEGEEYQTLEEFLAKNQIDPEGFHSLPVTVKIDGQTKPVPLRDVLKSYQLEGHVNNKSIELSNQQKAFEQERQQVQAAYKQQLDQARQLGQLAYNQLAGEYATINWDQLRATDPIQWAIKQQEFQQRNGQIQQHLQAVTQQQQAETQRAEQERLKALPVEREKMLAARPEWQDEAKFKSARESILSVGRKLGYSDAELGAVNDHRQMLLLDMAARYAALQASAPEAVKRVRAAPVMAKPGARTNRDPSQVARQQARERFQKAPRDNDAAAAYFETLS